MCVWPATVVRYTSYNLVISNEFSDILNRVEAPAPHASTELIRGPKADKKDVHI